jgi:hypothetical protein
VAGRYQYGITFYIQISEISNRNPVWISCSNLINCPLPNPYFFNVILSKMFSLLVTHEVPHVTV